MKKRLFFVVSYLLLILSFGACATTTTGTVNMQGSQTGSQPTGSTPGMATPVGINTKSSLTITVKGGTFDGKKYTFKGGQALEQGQAINIGFSLPASKANAVLFLKSYAGKKTYTIQASGTNDPASQGDVAFSIDKQAWSLSSQQNSPYPSCTVKVTSETAAQRDPAGNQVKEIKGTIKCDTLPTTSPNTDSIGVDEQFDTFVSITN